MVHYTILTQVYQTNHIALCNYLYRPCFKNNQINLFEMCVDRDVSNNIPLSFSFKYTGSLYVFERERQMFAQRFHQMFHLRFHQMIAQRFHQMFSNLKSIILTMAPFLIMLLISHYVTHFLFALNRGGQGSREAWLRFQGRQGRGIKGDHYVVECRRRYPSTKPFEKIIPKINLKDQTIIRDKTINNTCNYLRRRTLKQSTTSQ